MCFKLSKGMMLFYLALLCGYGSNMAIAQTSNDRPSLSSRVEFSAQPSTCVALRQGRNCSRLVTLQWQTVAPGNFCIYQKVTKKIIQCWKNSRTSQIQLDFESPERIEYQLVETKKNVVVAETYVDVSWVHKASPRKRRWRLF